MLLRDRTDADLAQCLRIAREVQERDDYPPRGSVEDDWFLRSSEQVAAWVAEDGGEVVGHVAVHSASEYVSTRLASEYLRTPVDEFGMVARLFVDPAYRASGVGQALLAQATDAIVERGLQPVLDVATHLSGAIALYESAGWTRAGEVILDSFDGEPIEPPLPLYVYVGRVAP